MEGESGGEMVMGFRLHCFSTLFFFYYSYFFRRKTPIYLRGKYSSKYINEYIHGVFSFNRDDGRHGDGV